jgi:replication initiation and membrane attachment protein DnaB
MSEVERGKEDSIQSKREKLILYFETTSPIRVVMDASNVDIDQKVIEIIQRIISKRKLPLGVVNVLIHYVLLRNNLKLNSLYAEKIAAHWSRNKIDNVEAAIEIAREMYDTFKPKFTVDFDSLKKLKPNGEYFMLALTNELITS